MPSEVELAQQAHQQQLGAYEKKASVSVSKAYQDAMKQLEADLAAWQAKIAQAKAEGVPVKPYMLFQEARTKQLLAQAGALSQAYGEYVGGVTQLAQAAALREAFQTAAQQMATHAGKDPAIATKVLGWGIIPDQTIQNMVGAFWDDSPLSKLIGQFGEEARKQVRTALTQGIASGKSAAQMAASVKQAMGISRLRAQTIVRTEVLRASNQALLAAYSDAGVKYWRWSAHLGPRTCPACLALHGKIFRIDQPMMRHVNCRCSASPYFGDGTDAPWESGYNWLASQPLDVRQSILGVKGADAVEKGLLTLNHFVKLHPDTTWGNSFQTQSLAQAMKLPKNIPSFMDQAKDLMAQQAPKVVAKPPPPPPPPAPPAGIPPPPLLTGAWQKDKQLIYDHLVNGLKLDPTEAKNLVDTNLKGAKMLIWGTTKVPTPKAAAQAAKTAQAKAAWTKQYDQVYNHYLATGSTPAEAKALALKMLPKKPGGKSGGVVAATTPPKPAPTPPSTAKPAAAAATVKAGPVPQTYQRTAWPKGSPTPANTTMNLKQPKPFGGCGAFDWSCKAQAVKDFFPSRGTYEQQRYVWRSSLVAKSNDVFANWLKAKKSALQAIERYTGSDYRPMNRSARKGIIESPTTVKKITALDKAMNEDGVVFTEHTKIWRGITDNTGAITADMRPGGFVTDWGFMSTSFDRNTAKNFGRHYLVELLVPPGATALHVSHTSIHKGEDEVLFPRGTTMHILDVGEMRTDGRRLVTAEVVLLEE